MARAAVSGRLTWQRAAVVAISPETARASTLSLALPAWMGHAAGQHVDVRLRAEDGYVAERSYSIASAPEEPTVRLTVERLEEGEVSPYLVGELRAGDRLEVRGPIGGYFTWDAAQGGPLLLIAGGSGIVPLMAMLRHRRARGDRTPTRLLYSSRAYDEILYREELGRLAADDAALVVTHTLTRAQPPGWGGYRRRLDAAMLGEVAWPAAQRPLAFICGPTPFVEAAAAGLAALGHAAGRIKTERFGPTGG